MYCSLEGPYEEFLRDFIVVLCCCKTDMCNMVCTLCLVSCEFLLIVGNLHYYVSFCLIETIDTSLFFPLFLFRNLLNENAQLKSKETELMKTLETQQKDYDTKHTVCDRTVFFFLLLFLHEKQFLSVCSSPAVFN